MPMLYALGQHGALLSLQDFLLPHEHLFVYLDDIYVFARSRGPDLHIFRCARIQVHLRKTQVWNRGGHYPPACQQMQEAAARADPQARVWRGEGPPAQQGVRVLGIPIGHEEFVQAEFRATSVKHQTLVERIHWCRIFKALGCLYARTPCCILIHFCPPLLSHTPEIERDPLQPISTSATFFFPLRPFFG